MQNASARATVSGEVSRLGTSSTSGSTGTGLKKCMPITRCGWGVTAASFMIGMEDVLLASSASGRTTLPSAWKIGTFSASSSITASTTRSRSASSATSVAVRIRPSAASRSALASLPDFSARASDLRMRPSAFSAAASFTSQTMTSQPARADTSAMPVPMIPPPMTPTVDTCFPGSWSSCYFRSHIAPFLDGP